MHLKNLKTFTNSGKYILPVTDVQGQGKRVFVSDSSKGEKPRHFGEISVLETNRDETQIYGRPLHIVDTSHLRELEHVEIKLNNSTDYSLKPREHDDVSESLIELMDQKCVVSHSDMFSLQGEVLESSMKKLNDAWQLNSSGQLERIFTFKDFHQAMLWANKIAELADKEDHHPDLHISWGKCAVKIWTHAVNGLTKNDLILAAKIDALR